MGCEGMYVVGVWCWDRYGGGGVECVGGGRSSCVGWVRYGSWEC